jgi:S1-C subfamily serine protease
MLRRLTKTRWVPALVTALALALGGCITLDQQKPFVDEPPRLRAGARDFRGADEARVVVRAKQTFTNADLTSALVRELAERSRRGVVSVYAKTETRAQIHLLPLPFLGIPVRLPGQGLGSGFFIHPSGLLLTNNHVIQSAAEIRVLLSDGKDYGVEVLARDRVYDLALMRVIAPDRQFDVIPMGNDDEVAVGDFVIAVGNPLGLGHSVTHGIISQTERNLSGITAEDARNIDFIQHDAAINPGSSGGPLITATGAWVGVNTAGAVGAQNLGFAVPSSQAVEFLSDVRAGRGDPDP